MYPCTQGKRDNSRCIGLRVQLLAHCTVGVKLSLPDAAVGVSHHHTCFVSLRAAVEVLASCVVAVVSSVCDRFLAQALFYNTKVVTASAGVSPGDRGREAQGFTRPEPIPKHGYLYTRRSYRFLNKITVCAARCSWPSVRREQCVLWGGSGIVSVSLSSFFVADSWQFSAVALFTV